MPRSIWSTPPSLELLRLAVRSLGVEDENSINWFDASHLVKPHQDEVILRLRACYYKCMAKRYLDKENMTYKDYLLVVRQILRHHNRQLERREKCIKVDNELYRYFPQYRLKPLPATGEITFE